MRSAEYGKLDARPDDAAMLARSGALRGRRRSARRRSSACSRAGASAARACSPGGVCFRIPDEVLHDWSRDLGLTTMTPEGIDAALSRGRGGGARRDRAGRHALAQHGALRRGRGEARHPDEVDPPQHAGLPRRVSLQLRLPPRREDERRLLVPAGRLRPGRAHRERRARRAARRDRAAWRAACEAGSSTRAASPGVPFEVHAKVVVVACGSLHTPLLLRASGVGSWHVGRHMTLHPGVRVTRHLRRAWSTAGTARCRASTATTSRPTASRSSASSRRPSILSAAFPGIGPKHRENVHKMPRSAVFGGDDPRRRRRARAPLARSRAARDLPHGRRRTVRGSSAAMEIVARMGFVGGRARDRHADLRARLAQERARARRVRRASARDARGSSARPTTRSARPR